jgi:hypothetical protein
MSFNAAPYLPFLFLIPVLALIVWRNSRPRRLRVEMMWVRPAILVGLAVVVLSHSPPATPTIIGACLVALVVGVGLGWMRGKMMRISVDPESHVATVQGSPLAIALILGVIGVRYGMRYLVAQNASGLLVNVAQATDVLMLFALGLVGAQGLEMWIRARRQISDSKAAKASGAIVS